MDRPESTLSHLECTACGRLLDADRPANLCPCGGVLFARYDLERAAAAMTPERLAARRPDLWRWAEVLPVRAPGHRLDLGAGATPLLAVPRLGRSLGCRHLLVKEESLNPTGSFKARGMATAVGRLAELGLDRAVVPTAGNAGVALAAYAAAAGIAARAVVPRDTPAAFLRACRLLGAEVVAVDGTIADCGREAARMARDEGFFDLATMKEPCRVEGKKTMGFELWLELGRLPDVVVYPTGGGTGLVGMAKAFGELEAMGLADRRRPRLFSVQSTGCAPVVAALASGADTTSPWPAPATFVNGLRVPSPHAGRLVVDALRRSGGGAVAVADDAIRDATLRLARSTGLLPAPEAGAALAALERLLADGRVGGDEAIVLFATGGAALYLESLFPGRDGLP